VRVAHTLARPILHVTSPVAGTCLGAGRVVGRAARHAAVLSLVVGVALAGTVDACAVAAALLVLAWAELEVAPFAAPTGLARALSLLRADSMARTVSNFARAIHAGWAGPSAGALAGA